MSVFHVGLPGLVQVLYASTGVVFDTSLWSLRNTRLSSFHRVYMYLSAFVAYSWYYNSEYSELCERTWTVFITY